MADKLINGIAVNADWDPSQGDYVLKEPGYEERINLAKKTEKKSYFGVIAAIALLVVPVALLLLSLAAKIKI
ncbi:MAG: hypothetical protein HUU54_06875 [Ignavibacteriaceae bacterium]|nr:hypothetical protein [Ignavibacteriaceae bacterium]